MTAEDFRLGLELADQADPQYAPVWAGLSPHDRAALALYFLSRPRKTGKQAQAQSTEKKKLAPARPRAVSWYGLASQECFPTGHRYTINTFAGRCGHSCSYCYAVGYQFGPAREKRHFKRSIEHDMAQLDRCAVPPAPIHLCISADPFQPLEVQLGHTRYALEQILAHRNRFTTVVILTKNPKLPIAGNYLGLFKALMSLPASHPRADEFRQRSLPAFVVEVSLAFWREEARLFYEPCAPSVESRVLAVRALRAEGIPVVIRIDPLFPRSPLPSDASLGSFGLPEAQTLDDLEHLVALAAEVGALHVVYSPAKICKPWGSRLSGPMQAMKSVYEAMAAPGKLDFRGASWRLPCQVAIAEIVAPFLQTCDRYGVRAKYCKQNLLETP